MISVTVLLVELHCLYLIFLDLVAGEWECSLIDSTDILEIVDVVGIEEEDVIEEEEVNVRVAVGEEEYEDEDEDGDDDEDTGEEKDEEVGVDDDVVVIVVLLNKVEVALDTAVLDEFIADTLDIVEVEIDILGEETEFAVEGYNKTGIIGDDEVCVVVGMAGLTCITA